MNDDYHDPRDDIPANWVLLTEEEPGVARATVVYDDECHRFEISLRETDSDAASAQAARIDYQETLSDRGVVRVAEPSEDVVDLLRASDDFVDFVDSS